jgi:hydroxyacylglutathione hydrolase
MAQVVRLTYNPFAENTYLVYDESGECVIIDPGCYASMEERHLAATVQEKGLRPVRLLNTHGHIDHVFGNRFVLDTWGLEAEMHAGEHPVLRAVETVAAMYGVPLRQDVPPPGPTLEDGDVVRFGNSQLRCILAPGHSPAHLCFYSEEDGFLIGGDVLFRGSIGRTDLPGGDYDTLIHSIRTRIYTLPDQTVVWPGHEDETTIGREARLNPFVTREVI